MVPVANLITGDAVTLELRVAGLPSRLLALTIDLVVTGILLVVGTVLVNWIFSNGGSPGAQAAVTLSTIVLVVVGWPTLIETITRGRSPGKAVMGLRVVRDDGGPIRMRHALVRALAMVFLDLWLTSGALGGLSALLSSRSKRFGDRLAGTIVIGERIPRATASAQQPILMPAALAGWAAGLDLVGIPDGLALTTRTFLVRAASLDPAARGAMAARLATQMAGYVRTPAPPGTPAEAYLAAVLSERTRRAWWAASPAAAASAPPAGPAPAPGPAPVALPAPAPPPAAPPAGFTPPGFAPPS